VLITGSYHIEVSADGYEMKKMWIKIGPEEDKNLRISLKELPHLLIQTPKVVDRNGRFEKFASGVVLDTKTDLEWYAGPDKDTRWNEAKRWVESLSVSGGGWRMPTREELKTLYKKGVGERNMTPLLKITGWYVWSGQTEGSSSAWTFGFYAGIEDWYYRDPFSISTIPIRGFAVRSRR
jgi:hypothetical protein